MLISKILTKIEYALGYVEMGKKSWSERVDAIIERIGELRSRQFRADHADELSHLKYVEVEENARIADVVE